MLIKMSKLNDNLDMSMRSCRSFRLLLSALTRKACGGQKRRENKRRPMEWDPSARFRLSQSNRSSNCWHKTKTTMGRKEPCGNPKEETDRTGEKEKKIGIVCRQEAPVNMVEMINLMGGSICTIGKECTNTLYAPQEIQLLMWSVQGDQSKQYKPPVDLDLAYSVILFGQGVTTVMDQHQPVLLELRHWEDFTIWMGQPVPSIKNSALV